MKNLILFSDFTENDNSDFVNAVRKNFIDRKYKLTYIRSRSDKTRKYYNATTESLKKYGDFNFVYFDSDEEFNEDLVEEVFETSDIIFLSGGNTFYFLNNLKKRNLISKLKDFISRGGWLFGLSAGAIIMSEDISIAYHCDENNINLNDLSSLNLVDFEFMPHWDESEYDRCFEDLKEHSKVKKKDICLCNDGDGIIVNGDVITFYGNIKTIKESI